jgi:hypothetical protein
MIIQFEIVVVGVVGWTGRWNTSTGTYSVQYKCSE